jgi:hypothetical protein
MDFNKLSLGSPMAQANPNDDLFDESGIPDDELLLEDNPLPDAAVARAQPDGCRMPQPQPFSFPKPEDYVCSYISDDVYKSRGTLLQFINQNCADAANVIGGVRIPVADACVLPAYLDRYRAIVKQHAIRHLTRHLVETQNSAGAGENLCPDDYGMSYMLASVSKAGRTLPPSGRSEGPLIYCMYPKLISPVPLYVNPDGSIEKVHVVNVYIHLYDANRRRRAVLDRARRAEEAKHAASMAPPPSPPAPQPVAVAVKRKNSGAPQPPSTQHYPTSTAGSRQVHIPLRQQAAVWQPPPPPPVARPPPPPTPENYPPMPEDHPQINWPASPKLLDFPPAQENRK